ncbi:YiiX/YebB-like N1pC/P60 family cysteine hydrolase [Planctomycetes bacterium K23_9]|uniref:Permuted papain-like amidase enzyme, YaeF/YiiX, C92 family n=1 Tax=Stieleria marina TaxID=1930275 RepID=A0A517NRK0_9BACT|nr:hypothetical protein K239x_16750 [Planctomycetes bacterium K23_9]
MCDLELERTSQTVLDLADHMNRLREDAVTFRDSFATGDRGYFSPTEDEQVTHLWVSYHQARNALLQVIDSIRSSVGEPTQETAGEFLAAYAASVVLVDAARTLRDLFGDDVIVRRKLNESFDLFGIAEGSFDAVQMSLTNFSNAIGIKRGNRFFDEHLTDLHKLADTNETYQKLLGVIDFIGEKTRVEHRSYIRARARDRTKHVVDKVIQSGLVRAVYAIQEWGGRVVGRVSTSLSHVPRIPLGICDGIRGLIQPGDVFVTRKTYAATNYFLPGYWPHAVFYIGGDEVVEAQADGVRRRTLDSPFSNDAIVVIRPKLDKLLCAEAVSRATSHVGKPYDFDFDFTRGDRLVCTEVVYRSLEGLGGTQFVLSRRAGRETLSAEDLLRMAISGERFEQVAVFCPDHDEGLLVGAEMDRILRATVACD